MSAPRPYVTDPFHPLGSTCNNKSFLYINQSEPAISSKWYVKVCLGTGGICQLRMCFSETLSPRLRTIIQDILTSVLCVLLRINPKYMDFSNAHLLKKKTNWPLSR